MKKLLKITCIVFALSLIFTACGKKTEAENSGKTDNQTSAVSAQSGAVSSEVSEETSTTVVLNRPTTTTSASSAPQTTSKQSSAAGNTPSQSSRTSASAAQKTVTNPTYVKGVLIANKSYALPSDYNPGVDPAAQSAFSRMSAAAAAEGINLYIVSGFRSYSTQAGIYNNYVAQDGKAAADRYSARPGHSEHQTGLAFDVNSLSQSFENTPEGKWLAANCHNYGFIIRYPKGKEGITGYMYEPWHIRYLGASTAAEVYSSGLTLEEYLGINSVYSD